MRKLIAIGMLIGGLLAGPQVGPAMAQFSDPLQLATSGVLIPFITTSTFTSFNNFVAQPFAALVEVASPVGLNDGRGGTFPLHLVFFNATCVRFGSAELPETTNDIGFVDINGLFGYPPAGGTAARNGLVAIAGSALGNELVPLSNPIHSRVYEFGIADGRSRIFEPIAIDTFDLPQGLFTWNPLRTGATFFAPQETDEVKTVLTLVCPRATIQNGTTTNIGAFPITPTAPNTFGFPAISPAFNASSTPMFGRVYDTNEVLLRDINFVCDCLTEISVAGFDGGSVYKDTGALAPQNGGIGALFGTYTELEVTNPNPDTGTTRGSFTGYRSVSSTGSPANNFFGRLSNGSRNALNSLGGGAR
jgi:hypothetical protein